MATVNIEVPSALPSALGKRPADTAREIQLMAALKLFECGRISGGMAAEFAGVPRAEFVALCGQYGVGVFQQTAEELIADVKAIADARHR
jgi:predicted HTH domain antitoxin